MKITIDADQAAMLNIYHPPHFGTYRAGDVASIATLFIATEEARQDIERTLDEATAEIARLQAENETLKTQLAAWAKDSRRVHGWMK